MPFDLPFERLFGGLPLLAPTDNWWESGVTFNSAAVYLTQSPENLPAIRALLGEESLDQYPDGIVVLHYRARPALDPGHPWTRSFIGVSLHHPDLTPIRRFSEPIVSPGQPGDADHHGVEDPRISWLDASFWMVYCGVMPIHHVDPLQAWRGSICVAKSQDLMTWQKLGAATGTGLGFGERLAPESVSNKDGVLFPDRIDGKAVMLHRPMVGDMGIWGTSIATAQDPVGPYTDHGTVHKAMPAEQYEKSWAGAGSVPIKIGEGRYISIEHTGNYMTGFQRKYLLDAFLYDFNQWDPERPESLVVARLDDIMRPETDYEIKSHFTDSVANVVFTCGSYVHDGWLYVVYGGGDSYILAARIRFETLVKELESREVP